MGVIAEDWKVYSKPTIDEFGLQVAEMTQT
jgi:hypothetical protein